MLNMGELILKYKKDLTNHKLILDSKSLVETFEQTHTTTTQQARPTVGYENFAKNGGDSPKNFLDL